MSGSKFLSFDKIQKYQRPHQLAKIAQLVEHRTLIPKDPGSRLHQVSEKSKLFVNDLFKKFHYINLWYSINTRVFKQEKYF